MSALPVQKCKQSNGVSDKLAQFARISRSPVKHIWEQICTFKYEYLFHAFFKSNITHWPYQRRLWLWSSLKKKHEICLNHISQHTLSLSKSRCWSTYHGDDKLGTLHLSTFSRLSVKLSTLFAVNQRNIVLRTMFDFIGHVYFHISQQVFEMDVLYHYFIE